MRRALLGVVILVLAAAGCSTGARPEAAATAASPTPIGPPVVGPDPSYRVAAFYYPWYGTPTADGTWIHWQETHFQPPDDISSDYYPQLGPYSSKDPQVVAQHMAWLRQAGIGVIYISWQGQRSNEDRNVPLLLSTAARYGIKVAFQIEPYNGRSATQLVEDIKYIYNNYGSSPAFFRTTAVSRYSPGHQPKALFLMYCAEYAGWECGKNDPVDAAYWRSAMDAVHALPESPMVIANSLNSAWVTDGHFDGLNNYITLHLDTEGGFSWADGLPPDSLYVPAVMPGNSAHRIGYPDSTYVPRRDGQTYDEQWAAALGTGVEPEMVIVTSFNEWHEGSFIEPPAFGRTNGRGYTYADFGALPADGYLTLTRQEIGKFLAAQWPATYRARIQVRTT
jgi:hypothetical protein